MPSDKSNSQNTKMPRILDLAQDFSFKQKCCKYLALVLIFAYIVCFKLYLPDVISDIHLLSMLLTMGFAMILVRKDVFKIGLLCIYAGIIGYAIACIMFLHGYWQDELDMLIAHLGKSDFAGYENDVITTLLYGLYAVIFYSFIAAFLVLYQKIESKLPSLLLVYLLTLPIVNIIGGTVASSSIPWDLETKKQSDSVNTSFDIIESNADQNSALANAFSSDDDRALLQCIADNHRYPSIAAKKGIEGDVVVAVIFESDGSLSSREIHNSSGNDMLDRDGISTIDRAKPCLESHMHDKMQNMFLEEDKKIRLFVPLQYRLKRDSI